MESSSYLAIELTDVSVRYRVPTEPVRTLKEHVVRLITRRQNTYRDFVALQNISYSVRAGEAVGVIGRNGAGKSTLLKVISRVLVPTRGRVRVAGKISPLIELGMGFQGELTGRENIYINAAMLGFPPGEINKRMDRIIDFAELSDFIDSPIRTYSSGMVARLGFSVAIDVEPDILVIDEVLSVGDLAFQNKCMERLKDFRRKGVTIIYVTHAVGTLPDLCDSGLLLDNSNLICSGDIDTVVKAYQQLLTTHANRLS